MELSGEKEEIKDQANADDTHLLTFVVKSKYKSEINEIESNENVLSQSDVLPSICKIGKNIEENEMTSRITGNNTSMMGNLYIMLTRMVQCLPQSDYNSSPLYHTVLLAAYTSTNLSPYLIHSINQDPILTPLTHREPS